ncbi:MAG: amino acid ABC transporter permease [Eubacteriales bacterium]|nr:amino acid ABC transporter permease [Eubacteriales bacterium]
MSWSELIAVSYERLLSGLLVTIELALVSLLIACVLGLIFGCMAVSRNRFVRWLSTVYVDIVRGTPLLVQAFFVYFGLPNVLGIRLTAESAGIATLALNAGAYMAEIVRGGIQAVPAGQLEAARSLGMTQTSTMIKVVMPQAIRTMIPSFINQFIITLKDTSILSVIGLRELTQTGKIIIAKNFESFKMWLIVAIMYFVIIMILSRVSKWLERRMNNAQGKR